MIYLSVIYLSIFDQLRYFHVKYLREAYHSQ